MARPKTDCIDCGEPCYGSLCLECHMGMTVPRYPCVPTDAAPGTEEKIRVMAQRVEDGQPIFHADDMVVTPDYM